MNDAGIPPERPDAQNLQNQQYDVKEPRENRPVDDRFLGEGEIDERPNARVDILRLLDEGLETVRVVMRPDIAGGREFEGLVHVVIIKIPVEPEGDEKRYGNQEHKKMHAAHG